MLFAVRVLVVESFQLRLQSQQLRLLLGQLLLQLVDLRAFQTVFRDKKERKETAHCLDTLFISVLFSHEICIWK